MVYYQNILSKIEEYIFIVSFQKNMLWEIPRKSVLTPKPLRRLIVCIARDTRLSRFGS